jgi:hypothetical protein
MKIRALAVAALLLWGCRGTAPDSNTPASGSKAPATQSQPATALAPMEEEKLIRLITELAARVPGGWYVADAFTGEITPPSWPKGLGHRIIMREVPLTWEEFREKKGHRAEVYLVSPVRAQTRPASQSGTAQSMAAPSTAPATAPASELQSWHGWRVLATQDARYAWPKFEQEVIAALQAADGPAPATIRGARPPVIVGTLYVKESAGSGDSFMDFYWDAGIVDPESDSNVTFRMRPWHGGANLEFLEYVPSARNRSMPWKSVKCPDHVACFRGGIAIAVLPLSSLGSPPRVRAKAEEPRPPQATTWPFHPEITKDANSPLKLIVIKDLPVSGMHLPPRDGNHNQVIVIGYDGREIIGATTLRIGKLDANAGAKDPNHLP